MKAIKFLLLVMITNFTMSAQMAVVDAGANSQLGLIKSSTAQNYLKTSAILSKTISSLQTLQNMKQTYDEWTDAIRTVNNVIASGKEVINISNKVQDISELYFDAVSLISSEESMSSQEKDVYILVFTKILNRALSTLESSLDITSTGIFEMNDGERLGFVRGLEKEVNEHYSYMLYVYNKFKSAIQVSENINRNNALLNSSIEAVKN